MLTSWNLFLMCFVQGAAGEPGQQGPRGFRGSHVSFYSYGVVNIMPPDLQHALSHCFIGMIDVFRSVPIRLLHCHHVYHCFIVYVVSSLHLPKAVVYLIIIVCVRACALF